MNIFHYIVIDFLSFINSSIGISISLSYMICFFIYSVRQLACKPRRQNDTKARMALCYFKMNLAKAFFGDWVVNCNREEPNGRIVLLLFKKQFPLWTLTLVTANQGIIIVYIAAVFLNALLIERSDDCKSAFTDPGFNCFLPTNSDYYADPINCSDINVDEVEVLCLKFNINFPFAAGLAGGLLEFLPLLFTIPLYAIIKCTSKTSRKLQYTVYAIQLIALLALMCCAFLLLIFETVREYVFGFNIYDFFTYSSFFTIMFFVLGMPWSLATRPKINIDEASLAEEGQVTHQTDSNIEIDKINN